MSSTPELIVPELVPELVSELAPELAPQLTVVIAHVGSREALKRCAESVRASCRGIRTELLVMDAPATLVPQLWSAGIARAAGDIVALLTSQCTVSPGWAPRLLSALSADAVGAGGTFDLAGRSSLTDRAMFYLRYSAFLNGEAGGATAIAGDNAAYRRDALRRHAGVMRDGFWEVEFHQRVLANAGRLEFAPGASVEIQPGISLRSALAQRFLHGRHFGAWRAGITGNSTLRYIATAPLVPLVLAARVARRVVADREHRFRFVTALPVLLVLAAAWALGEGCGAMLAPRSHETAMGVPA